MPLPNFKLIPGYDDKGLVYDSGDAIIRKIFPEHRDYAKKIFQLVAPLSKKPIMINRHAGNSDGIMLFEGKYSKMASRNFRCQRRVDAK